MYQDLEKALAPYNKIVEQLKKTPALTDKNQKLLKDVLSRIDNNDIFWKAALIEVIEKYQEQFKEFLKAEAIAAAIKSGEYNYPLYLNRLSSSIDLANISIKIVRRSIEIRIDCSPLGDVREWAAAAEASRGSALTREQTFQNKQVPGEIGMNLALKMWKEKIYGAGRENKNVSKRVYDRKSKTYSFVDVTPKFRSKYHETIQSRLSKVDNAPFWYLIEHGNSNPPGFTSVAPAYPEVREQNFIDKARRRIKGFIAEKLNSYLPKKQEDWISEIARSLGLNVTPKLSELMTEYRNNMAIKISNLEQISQLNTLDIIGKITAVNKSYDIIVNTKSLGVRYRLND